MARALTDRDHAMELRTLSLAVEAIARGDSWVRSLGGPPSRADSKERWLREVSTVAAHRDRWNVEGRQPLGVKPDLENLEQAAQRKWALPAGERAIAIGASTRTVDQQVIPGFEVGVGTPHGIDL